MECINLREDVFEECLVVDLVDDGSVVQSGNLRVMSFLWSLRLLHLSLLEIVNVWRYVKIRVRLLYVCWLHLLIFKFLLISCVGLILIDFLIKILGLGHILIDFINLYILILFICIWIMGINNVRIMRLSNLLVIRYHLLQLLDELSKFHLAFLQLFYQIDTHLALE